MKGVDSMNQLPASCPLCQGALVVQKIHCRECDTTLSGHFAPAPGSQFEEEKLPYLRRFAKLSTEQLELLEGFIRCEGRMNRLQEEVGLSYPTLRSRLTDLIRHLGFTPREEEKAQQIDRRQVLADLQAGKISAEEAARLLRANRGK